MVTKLDAGFELARFSDLNYEEMTVEIRFNGVPLAQLSRDRGVGMQDLEIPSRFSPEGASFTFPVDAFILALNEAKKILEFN